ncbi:MAG: glycosyltransferase family 4 protein [Candidatus Njordarchaeales archaeon]
MTRICKRRESQQQVPQNITLISLPFPPLFGLVFQVLYSFFISSIVYIFDMINRFDMIYIRGSFLSIGFLTFRSLAKKTIVKIPAIIEDEISSEGILKSLIGKIALFTDRLVLAKAGKVAVIGNPLYYKLIRRCSFRHKEEPLEIPPGVDLDLIKKIKDELYKENFLNLSKEHYIVGFLGLMAWWQGVDVLVRSVAKLKGANLEKPVKLLLVGDGPEKRRIESLCKKLKVNYEITGFVKHEEALQYLTMFDVLALPSYKTSATESNVPIKVIEAWALGVPVITTRHERYRFMGLRDKEDIIFCEPNPDDLAEKILMILRDKELRKKLSKRGRQLAEDFCYDNIATKLINAFKAII